MLYLSKLESKLDQALSKETRESLTEWIGNKKKKPLNRNNMKKQSLEEFINSQPYYGHGTPEYLEGIEVGAKWQKKQARQIMKEKEQQYNNMLSMLQETYRRLEHTDMISLRKQIKEVLNFKSK